MKNIDCYKVLKMVVDFLLFFKEWVELFSRRVLNKMVIFFNIWLYFKILIKDWICGLCCMIIEVGDYFLEGLDDIR